MTNVAITWIVVGLVVAAAALGGWWYFSQSNSATVQPATTVAPVAKSSADLITSFAFSGLDPVVIGTINNANYTVNVVVPVGTDLTKLTPVVMVSDNATVMPLSGTMENFTNPVTYTVTAQDGTAQDYVITATAKPSGNGNVNNYGS